MAFFDDLGKKISQTGQTAVQKTKEMADIAKLNSMISDEEKRVSDNYREIGKQYAALHGEDPEEAFAGAIDAIHESERKIAEYKQQISDIKGVQKCEKCGAEVARGAAFCSSCGAPMPKPAEAEAPATATCPHCGAPVAEGVNFCTVCGKPVKEAAPEQTEGGAE